MTYSRMIFCGGLRRFQKTQVNQCAAVCCGGSAVVCGGSKKPNNINVRQLCGACVRQIPYYPIRSAGPIEARGRIRRGRK
jgi:hypothetical protein